VKKNPQRRLAVVWFVIAAVGFLMIVLPIPLGLDELHGGFAVGFLGFILLPASVMTGIICVQRARQLDRLVSGENLIAHWKYSAEEWKQYIETEHRSGKRERWRLFYLITVITVIVCFAFAIFRPESLMVVLVILPLLLALLLLVVLVVTTMRYRRSRNRVGEVFIGKDGVYLNGLYHSWKTVGGRLEKVSCVWGRGAYIEFRYSSRRAYARGGYMVRVPVPQGQEDLAKKVAAQFGEFEKEM